MKGGLPLSIPYFQQLPSPSQTDQTDHFTAALRFGLYHQCEAQEFELPDNGKLSIHYHHEEDMVLTINADELRTYETFIILKFSA